jgi:hypothetical protein
MLRAGVKEGSRSTMRHNERPGVTLGALRRRDYGLSHAQGRSMREPDTIGSELRLLAAVRRVAREHGGVPSIGPVDALLDERLDRAVR